MFSAARTSLLVICSPMDQPTTRRLQTSMSTANEWLNADLKHALGSRAQTRTKDKLRAVTKAHMDLLEQVPSAFVHTSTIL